MLFAVENVLYVLDPVDENSRLRPCVLIHSLESALALFAGNGRRQVLSLNVLKKTGKEQSKDLKNLKLLTKTIIDRFFNSTSPPEVQVCPTITISYMCSQRRQRYR